LIHTNEFFGSYLDQGGFTAASCKSPALVPSLWDQSGIPLDIRMREFLHTDSRFFLRFLLGSPDEVPLSAMFWQSVRRLPDLLLSQWR